MPGIGFIRVKLLQVDKGTTVTTSEPFDPFVAVNVKETVNSPGMFLWRHAWIEMSVHDTHSECAPFENHTVKVHILI